MQFLEKDLEDIIYNADKSKLFDRGLPISGKLKRQLKIGNYGIADLVSFKRGKYFVGGEYHDNHSITIFELKNDMIDDKAFFQALAYLKGIYNYWDKKRRSSGVDEIDFKIVLIGRRVDMKSPFIYLPYFMENLYIYTYDYNEDGISFKRIYNYSLVNQGF